MPRVSFIECVGREKAELIKKRSKTLYDNLTYQFDLSPIGHPSNISFRKVFNEFIDSIIEKYDLEVEEFKKLDHIDMIQLLFALTNSLVDSNNGFEWYMDDIKHCIVMNNPATGKFGFSVMTCRIYGDKGLYTGTNSFGQIIFMTTNKNVLFSDKEVAKMTAIVANAIITAYCSTSEKDNWINRGGN